MAKTGYVCGKCGYEPTEKQLQDGRCPQCNILPEPPSPLTDWRAARKVPTGSVPRQTVVSDLDLTGMSDADIEALLRTVG